MWLWRNLKTKQPLENFDSFSFFTDRVRWNFFYRIVSKSFSSKAGKYNFLIALISTKNLQIEFEMMNLGSPINDVTQFWIILIPSSLIVTLFITKTLKYCCHKIIDTLAKNLKRATNRWTEGFLKKILPKRPEIKVFQHQSGSQDF